MTISGRRQAPLSLKSLSQAGGDPARAMSLLFLLRRWRTRNAAAVPPRAHESHPSNASLVSLAGGELSERFHAWRGRSGRRYICSVFPIDPRDAAAGLPDFAEAVVIAVKTDAAGQCRVVGFCQCEHGAGLIARQTFVRASIAAGAHYWHVHLLTADPQKRRDAIADMAALCRPMAAALEPA